MSTMKPMEAIRCTLPNCHCDCFTPGKTYVRICDTCKHGWVAHALDKLGPRNVYQLGMQVEIVQPNIVFDIASLMLYGAQATPIRLKILLDRLFSVLQHEEVLQVLHSFGWSYEDYARGYILQLDQTRQEGFSMHRSPQNQKNQDPSGRVLDKWTLASREEEALILQQFLRFGETRSIAQEIILQDTKELQEKYTIQTPKSESEIKKFIERSNVAMQSFMRAYDARQFYSRFIPYPFATSPGAVPAPRMVSPPVLQRFSPPTTSRSEATREATREQPVSESTPAPSPAMGSPLNRLQTMHPFDYRREPSSPMISPASSEVSAASQISVNTSPQNLTVPATTSIPTSPSVPQSLVLKQEKPSDPKYGEQPAFHHITPSPVAEEALNFSTKDNPSPRVPPPNVTPTQPCVVPSHVTETPLSAREHYEAKARHARKATNPIKRHWQPSGAFGSTLVSPSGKKRVLCTACNKTFCDKGALKIHYSAVHLKEMHKCTVDGCNMVFSSRRSRNRHSANPNPKLHLPQNRRKLPEGARVVDDGKGGGAGSSVGSLICRPPSPGEIVESHSSVIPSLTGEQHKLTPSKHHIIPIDLPAGPPPSEQRYFLQPTRDPGDLMDPAARPQSADDENSTSSPTSQSFEGKSDTPTSSRSKRKSMVPTRCAQMEEIYPITEEGDNGTDGADKRPEGKDCNNGDDPFLANREEQMSEVGGDDDMDDLSDDSGQMLPEPMDPVSDEEYEGPQDLTMDTKRNSNGSSNDDEQMSKKSFLGLGMDPRPPDDPMTSLQDMEDSGDSGLLASPAGSEDSMAMDDNDENGIDIPLDTENPKKCTACGKLFQNHFSVKTHYQNVHLKLMHTCTIEGCNAAFPSKRSRDRHSSNLNLHRKLLSTSSDGVSLTKSLINQSLRDEFLPKIYENHYTNGDDVVENMENAELSREDQSAIADDAPNPEQTNGTSELTNGTNGVDSDEADEARVVNAMVECHICQELFRDNLVLKEHFETTHPKETYRCTIEGCDKIFSTRKSRNRHSQNGALHKHISPGQVNGAC